ncbi:hypothetical protein A8A12_15325 [Serratia marcescens]|nr:hypothetical protein A8A12_15325 [Serratia marcescens]
MVYLIHTDKKPLEFHDWQLPSHSLATKQSTLATKIQRGISSILNVTEAWELVYIIHSDKKPLQFHLSNRVASFATASTHSHFLQEMYILVIIIIIIIFFFFFLPPKVWRVTPPAAFVTDPRMRRQIVRIIREWCAMTFISDRGYGVRPRGEKAAQKSH